MVFPGTPFSCLLVLGKLGLLFAKLGSEEGIGQNENSFLATQHETLEEASLHPSAWHNSSSHQVRRMLERIADKNFRAAVRSSARRLLQFDSSTVPISNADRQEGLRLTRGCAVSLTVTIGRGCSVISETVPFYYIDQISRSVKINQTRTVTTMRAVCWGDVFTPDPFAAVDISPYREFSVGLGTKGMITACGILATTSALVCIGSNDVSVGSARTAVSGQADPPRGRYSQVSVGGLHGCALCADDGTCAQFDGASVGCWGNNRMGQTVAPLIKQISVLYDIVYVHVHCGYEHTCALRSDNYLACWGSNLDGQISIPSSTLATATKEGGYISTDNTYGCCNNPALCDTTTVTYPGVGARCRNRDRLAASWYHTCAIRAGCDVQCAGNVPRCASGAVGGWYAGAGCGCNRCVRPHELECWGYGAYAVATPPPGQFRAVVGSFDFSCAIYAECNGVDVVNSLVPGTNKTQCELANTVVCWGRNNRGQSAPPSGMCDGALLARLRAENILNNTKFETPAPPTPRPACICTADGCDCLGQNPRLQLEAAAALAPSARAAAAAAAALLAALLLPPRRA